MTHQCCSIMINENFKLYIHISPSWKYYVGITSLDVYYRWGKDGNGYKTQQLFYRAIQKYGWENFIHIVVIENLSKNDACELEKLFIQQLKSNNPEYGYNISNGGSTPTLGFHHTEYAKKKISENSSIPVDQYDINGNLIKSWSSMREAEKACGSDGSSIAKCCKGIYKTSKGFVWRYKGESFDKYSLKKYSQPKQRIKVKQYSKDGMLLKIWDSITEAAQELKLSTSSITGCCKGKKGHKSAGKYVWRYIDDDFHKYNIDNEHIKRVIQYDMDGKIINHFDSIVSASKNTGVSKSNINMCCLGTVKTAGGYIWRYESDNEKIDLESLKHRSDCKPVDQFDKNSLELIATYYSIRDASDHTKITTTSIIDCCKGRLKSAGGYVWQYKN